MRVRPKLRQTIRHHPCQMKANSRETRGKRFPDAHDRLFDEAHECTAIVKVVAKRRRAQNKADGSFSTRMAQKSRPIGISNCRARSPNSVLLYVCLRISIEHFCRIAKARTLTPKRPRRPPISFHGPVEIRLPTRKQPGQRERSRPKLTIPEQPADVTPSLQIVTI